MSIEAPSYPDTLRLAANSIFIPVIPNLSEYPHVAQAGLAFRGLIGFCKVNFEGEMARLATVTSTATDRHLAYRSGSNVDGHIAADHVPSDELTFYYKIACDRVFRMINGKDISKIPSTIIFEFGHAIDPLLAHAMDKQKQFNENLLTYPVIMRQGLESSNTIFYAETLAARRLAILLGLPVLVGYKSLLEPLIIGFDRINQLRLGRE